jgi:hypothetical protein|tara:strand:+ start:10984 stop:11301 length:318 start_codon:yes stop_codon:yes gene_type:complete
MQKYLSIYLTTPASRSLFSASQVTAVDMASVGTVKIWYHDGGSVTLTLSDNMTANDNSAANYIINQIAAAQQLSWQNVTVEIPQTLPGVADAAGAAVTIASAVVA